MKKINKIGTIILAFLIICSFASCTKNITNDKQSPKDAIIEKYGDTQFKISFYAGNLAEPISDMYYSAKNMPNLPTPERVGYVFSGWYFDSALTKPCDVSNDDLYWKMSNVTLYAKWDKEAIVNNGTYDIDFEAKLDESSIIMGNLASKYGYRNFADDIIADGTYIEKNDQGSFLRIQYNCHERGPIFGEGTDVTFEKQTYTVDDGGNGRLNESLSVLDRTSLIQTVYYNIDGLNLEYTITLGVLYYNWNPEINAEQRESASVSYKVNFNITRFIGFSKSFVNINTKLDNGTYLVPTHYAGLDKTPGMLDYFHPVYAYIIAQNGHYTLVKQLSAYNSDILSDLSGDDYFNRTTGYAREFTYFLTNQKNALTSEQEEDYSLYVPKLLDAKTFGSLTYEFFADSGKYYYTLDLGTSLDQDVIFYGGSTGAMEQMFSFPFTYRRLIINYDSIVPVSDIDYTPISGDSYTYKDSTAIYPGYTSNDFKNSNNDYDMLKQISYATKMVNLFFASTNGGTSGDKNFNTRMTITPTAQTLSTNLSDAQYKFLNFDIVYDAFGYNPKTDGELYSAGTSFINASTPTAASNFNIKKVDIGFSANLGDNLNIATIYANKVYPTVTDSSLSYQAYELDKNGNIDFQRAINISKSFVFEKEIAILYSAKYGNETKSCVVTILKSESPTNIKLSSDIWNYDEELGCYTSSNRYKVGDLASIPEITYNWNGRSYTSYTNNKYEDEELYSSFLEISLWDYQDGIYTREFSNLVEYSTPQQYNVFTMTSSKMRLIYRMTNRFGEFQDIEFEYRAEAVGDYILKDANDVLTSGDLKYTDGSRNKLDFEITKSYGIEEKKDLDLIPTYFNLNVTDGDVLTTNLVSFNFATIYLYDKTITVYDFDAIWDNIAGSKYSVVDFNYQDEYGDTVLLKGYYGFTIDGQDASTFSFINNGTTVFTDEVLEIEKAKISTSDYLPLTRALFKIYRLNGNNYEAIQANDATISDSTYGVSYSFLKEGTYLLTWQYVFKYDFANDKIFAAYNEADDSPIVVTFTQAEKVVVSDKNCDIDVTYVTDVNHPFKREYNAILKDGYYYYTKRVSMAETNLSLGYSDFEETSDTIYGWSSSTNSSDRILGANSNIGSLGVRLHTLNPTIYALWDRGVSINAYANINGSRELIGTVKYYRPETGRSYQVNLFDFKKFYDFKKYSDYEIVGWNSTLPIFSSYSNGKYVYSYYFETGTTNNAFSSGFYFDEKFELDAVLKKKISYIQYKAIDESGNDLKFTNSVSLDRNKISGYSLLHEVGQVKIDSLNKLKVNDSNLEIKYFAVKVNGELIKFNIDSDELKEEYFEAGNSITIYAVYGEV